MKVSGKPWDFTHDYYSMYDSLPINMFTNQIGAVMNHEPLLFLDGPFGESLVLMDTVKVAPEEE